VASGTLLSVGAVDPRGKTERTLETPRMFFSQPDEGAEAYFKPGKIPAVTVHQTLETETVKLSDSIDPRRAKTIPRMDRVELARLAEGWGEPDSVAPVAHSDSPSESSQRVSSIPRPWNQDYEPVSSLGERDHDGQIHASLSPFRDQAEPSFSLDGVSTRPEPFVQRRASDPPAAIVGPEPSAIPTQRDLPQHRIEASQPPPAPVRAPLSARAQTDSAVPLSEGVSPTTASIAADAPAQRSPLANYVAFAAALLLAVAFGLWLTRRTEPAQPSPAAVKTAQPALPGEPAVLVPARTPAPAPAEAQVAPVEVAPPAEAIAPAAPTALPRKQDVSASPKATMPLPTPAAPPAPPAPKSTPPKAPRETIF
jgi:hypothetical protein